MTGHSIAPKALVAVIQEAHGQGISTRGVDDLVKAMGMSGISKSEVPRLCAEIDERVQVFLNRFLEGDWPFVWLDATYVRTAFPQETEAAPASLGHGCGL